MKKLPEKETDIQLAICEYLALKQRFFWRQNSIPPTFMKNGQMQFRRMPKYSINGVPDLIVLCRGTFIGLEVKRPGGRQSAHQFVFERKCKEAGCEYYIVESVEDVITKAKL